MAPTGRVSRRLAAMLATWAAAANAAAPYHFQGTGRVSQDDIENVLSNELTHGGARVGYFEDQLRTLFTSLPKDARGVVGHQAVRYGLHRFFAQRHGWFIRGLEPGNATWNPDVMAIHGKLPASTVKEWVPGALQDFLEARKAYPKRGMELTEMATMAAALEDLVHKEVEERLKMLYKIHEQEVNMVSRDKAEDILVTYLMYFLLANNMPTLEKEAVMNARKRFIARYRGYDEVHKWFEELKEKRIGANSGTSGLDFKIMASVVHDIGEQYHAYNEHECEDLRTTLAGAEGRQPGRVRLSTFYNMSRFTHWRFAEKAEYLKALGALDETDPKQPAVIIPNYVMSRSNCLEVSSLYAICCLNACESLTSHLEKEIGGPSAAPARVLALVEELPSASVVAPRVIHDRLVDRLSEIAAQHGGQVPIHGRLFAQWMHHAFPRECPFPHEATTINPQTADEWMKENGHDSEQVTEEEMKVQMDADPCSYDWDNTPECEDEMTDIPWNPAEELLTQEL